MDWWLISAILFGTLVVLIVAGIPIAFAFGLLNIIGLFFFVGGSNALSVLTYSGYETIASFVFIAVPLFLLIGNIVFHCGISSLMVDGISKVMAGGRGSLYFINVMAAVVFAAVSGSSMASCAALGAALVPEGQKRGYNTQLMLGLLAGGGALAILIPPSGLMVVFAGISKLSIADLLIGGIIPGLVIAALFVGYLLIRLRLDPKLLPPAEVWNITRRERIAALRFVAPLGLIVFSVVGVIYLGLATPSEAAATGALASFILAALYRRLNLKTLRDSVVSTVRTSGMIFFILLGSKAFSEILAFTGASKGLVEVMTDLPLPPVGIFICLLAVIVFLGFFMDQLAIMFITVPVYFPIFQALDFNLLWCGLTMMVAIELGTMTPPFGVNLFVLKGVAPPGVKLTDIYRSAIPFACLHLLGMFLLVAFQPLATWLPGQMS